MRLGDAPWRSLREEAFDVTRAARAARGTPRLGEAGRGCPARAVTARTGGEWADGRKKAPLPKI